MAQPALLARISPAGIRDAGQPRSSVTVRRHGLAIADARSGRKTPTEDDTIFELEDGARIQIREVECGVPGGSPAAVDQADFEIFVDEAPLADEDACVREPRQCEYRFVTQADRWFEGKFSGERLSQYVSHMASEGWRVIAATTSNRATWLGRFGGTVRQEVVVALEREVTTGSAATPHCTG